MHPHDIVEGDSLLQLKVKIVIRTTIDPDGLSNKLTVTSKLYQFASKAIVRTIPVIPSSKKYNLTISKTNRFIWFRVAKVGTRSVFSAFDNARVELVAVHPMSCHYPEGLFRDYFKFAFVRNPYDRVVSAWQDKVIRTNYFGLSDSKRQELHDFESFVNFIADSGLIQSDHHIIPQTQLIDFNNIDFLGRFENFEEDLYHVFDRLSVPIEKLQHRNSSGRTRRYQDHYSSNALKLVETLYERDIQLLRYSFEDG